MNDNFPVCCCIIKDDKVIRRCKVHAEEIEFLGKQLYVLKEGYAIKSRELDFLEVDKTELLKALKEISKGEGRYNQDQRIHASNTIEDMKEIAQEAVEKYGGEG